mmetsp:Transcript_39644/g.64304  ORF Transcript_39644/g.64304 Transcript_39644/m.64304 type:complete len:602 (+) Transcript_39644:99-1904(+)
MDDSESEEEFGEIVEKKSSKRQQDDVDLSDDEEFNDGYGSDLQGDEKDRNWLASLTELEREQELAQRHNKRDVARERWELMRKIKATEAAGGSVSVPERHRTSSSNRSRRSDPHARRANSHRSEATKISTALSDIKAKKDSRANRRTVKGDDSDYQDSSPDGSPVRKAPGSARKESPPKDSKHKELFNAISRKPAEASEPNVNADEKYKEWAKSPELKEIFIKRDTLEKWLYEPFFSKAVDGLLVRFSMGIRDSRATYCVGQIIAVKEVAKMYQVGESYTNKGLVLRGMSMTNRSEERVYRMDTISNKLFTEEELSKFQAICIHHQYESITPEDIKKRVAQIKDAENYIHKPAEIDAILKAKEEMGVKPRNLTTEKANLVSQRDEAWSVKDMETYQRISEEIDRLDKQVRISSKKRTAQLESTASINERNRKLELQYQEERDKQSLNSKKDGVVKTHDPFSRRPCRPATVLVVSKTAMEDHDRSPNPSPTPLPLITNGSSQTSQDTLNPNPSPSPSPIDGVITPDPASASPTPINCIVAAHSVIDIDIKIESAPDSFNSNPLLRLAGKKRLPDSTDSGEQSTGPPKHQRLTLKDYRQRMGL